MVNWLNFMEKCKDCFIFSIGLSVILKSSVYSWNLVSKYNDDLCFDAELCDQSGAAEPSANEKTAIATSRQLESLGLGQYSFYQNLTVCAQYRKFLAQMGGPLKKNSAYR